MPRFPKEKISSLLGGLLRDNDGYFINLPKKRPYFLGNVGIVPLLQCFPLLIGFPWDINPVIKASKKSHDGSMGRMVCLPTMKTNDSCSSKYTYTLSYMDGSWVPWRKSTYKLTEFMDRFLYATVPWIRDSIPMKRAWLHHLSGFNHAEVKRFFFWCQLIGKLIGGSFWGTKILGRWDFYTFFAYLLWLY